jgi:DNA invertase Pin-like site-specific DNA recombinase
MEAQRSAIEAECERRGWTLEHVYADVGSGRNANRPELVAAMHALTSGLVTALVVAKLDRLSRSVRDFANILEAAKEGGWSLILLDLAMDTSTPSGEFAANVMISAAQPEARLVSARTREALAAHRSQSGRVGRLSGVPGDVRARIARERAEGRSYPAIAEGRIRMVFLRRRAGSVGIHRRSGSSG